MKHFSVMRQFSIIGLTVSENPWGGELDGGQSTQVIEHGAAVALLLCVIHEGADVVLLAVIPDTRTYHHGDFI